MRAEEALRKPGDAARRESDGAVLIACWSGGRLCARKVYPFSSGVPFPLTYWTGEDWQPLVSAERVRELEETHAERVRRLRDDVATRARWIGDCYDAAGGKEHPDDSPVCVEDVSAIIRQRFEALTAELEKALKNGLTLSRYGLPPNDVSGKEAWTTAAGEIWAAARKLPAEPTPTPAPAKPEWLAKGVRAIVVGGEVGWAFKTPCSVVHVSDQGELLPCFVSGEVAVIPHPDNDPELAAALEQE